MYKLLHFLVYLIYRAGSWAVGLLPVEWAFRAGKILGGCAYHVLPQARRVAVENLSRAYAGEKSHAEVLDLAKQHFRLLGANLIAGIKLSVMPPERIAERVTLEIPESVAARRQAERRGWVAMISHIGNWELYSQLRHLLPEYRLGAVYHPVRNRFIESHLRQLRSRFDVELFDRRSGLAKAARFLREGGVVGVLIDQYAGSAGVWTPLFGRLASTSPLAAALALHARSPIVPIAVYTTGVARWRLVISPPIENARDDSNLLTALMNRQLDAQIRVSPADWLWSHNRWKTSRPHFLFGYHQRGVAAPSGPVFLQPFRILAVLPRAPDRAQAALEAVRAIKDSRPDVELTVLATVETASVWNSEAAVHRVIAIRPDEGLFDMIRALQKSGSFDAAFLFSEEAGTSLAVRLASVPVRVGSDGWLARLLVNRRVKTGHRPGEPEFYLELARAAGANTSGSVAVRWSGLDIKLSC